MTRQRKIAFFGLFTLGTVVVSLIFQWPDRNFHYVSCDVGQGDAALIQVGFFQMLIDVGKDAAVIRCLSEQLPFWDRHIDVVIISHADHDHIGGLDEVVASYSIGALYMNPDDKTDETLKTLLKDRSIVPRSLATGDVLSVRTKGGKLEFSTLWPPRCTLEKSDNDTQISSAEAEDTRNHFRFAATRCSQLDTNDGSLSGVVKYGRLQTLFTGDISTKTEIAMVAASLLPDIDILKVSHHGSKTSTSTEFLQMARPETAIISVGAGNSYGHPDPSVVDRLRSQNIKVLLTSIDGSIHIVSDGNHYWVKK